MSNSDLYYTLGTQRYCHIFNFENFKRIESRKGTDEDAKAMEELFIKLNFTVGISQKDLTKRAMKDELKRISQKINDLPECSIFICIILSHGNNKYIHCYDDKMNIDIIVDYFKGNACAKLLGKPKLFLIQACRGAKMDSGVQFDGLMNEDDNSVKYIPTDADILMGYSTVDGKVSWRSKDGSWYIQSIKHIFDNYHQQLDVLSMLTMVNNRVATQYRSDPECYKQQPSFMSNLRKMIKFVD